MNNMREIGSKMVPTNKFRYVQIIKDIHKNYGPLIVEYSSSGDESVHYRLQQLWVNDRTAKKEWRDIRKEHDSDTIIKESNREL